MKWNETGNNEELEISSGNQQIKRSYSEKLYPFMEPSLCESSWVIANGHFYDYLPWLDYLDLITHSATTAWPFNTIVWINSILLKVWFCFFITYRSSKTTLLWHHFACICILGKREVFWVALYLALCWQFWNYSPILIHYE